MTDFTLHSTTVRTANGKKSQADVNAAFGRILAVVDGIGSNPSASDADKVEALKTVATFLEAIAHTQVPSLATAAPAAIGPAPAVPTLSTPAVLTATTTNPADQRRIAELEGSYNKVAALLGFTAPTTGGKLDLALFEKEVEKAVNGLKASSPAPAADTVTKVKVRDAAKHVREASMKLKSPVLKGGHINGLDELNRKLDELDGLAK